MEGGVEMEGGEEGERTYQREGLLTGTMWITESEMFTSRPFTSEVC